MRVRLLCFNTEKRSENRRVHEAAIPASKSNDHDGVFRFIVMSTEVGIHLFFPRVQ
jgi:hypothetical protein